MRGQASERTGAAIRKLRLAKGWTLAELGAASGLPVSTLSRLELGQNALNHDKLFSLCRALDVDVSGLMADQAERTPIATGRRSVARAGEGEAVAVGPHAGRLGAAELLDRAFTPIVLEVACTGLEDHGPMIVGAGEAYLHVLAGEVVLHGLLYAPLRLEAGDGVYFDTRSPYALLTGGSPARVLVIQSGLAA
jgi:transcriptional regulator with XRE-family HTH domain